MLKTDNLYPYLAAGPIDPEWEALCVPVGHGVCALLYEDDEAGGGLTHTAVTAEQLRAAGLTPAEAHRIALGNLTRFADHDGKLSIQVLGTPGSPVHFLLYSDHPRASACLRLPDLYDHARSLLGTDGLCACVPQPESLVVLPKRDRVFRENLIGKLREIEADTERPLSFELFDVTPDGVRPFTEV